MTFTQQTFLGSSIRGFNASAGWGTQVSTLDVNLVDDPKNGDSFNPSAVGSPLFFTYGDFTFGGLLQSTNTHYGQDGNTHQSVQLQDPRLLLEGVHIILQDYSGGTYSVPNLYNVYGYLESTYGFGGSLSNDTGVPWYLIRNAMNVLQSTSPIRLMGHYFVWDVFPQTLSLPDSFRIPGNSISALDYINEICNATGYDYIVTLDDPGNRVFGNIPLGGIIRVNLISRKTAPIGGAIDRFVTSISNVVSKSQGFEFRNETTSKFIVGGRVEKIYYQTYEDYNNDDTDNANGGIPNFYDNTIWPYWGKNESGNAIVGEGDFLDSSGAKHIFTLNGSDIAYEVGINGMRYYTSDIAEMRAAAESQEEWEAFLWFYNDEKDSIHYRKAEMLGLSDGFNRVLKEWLVSIKDRRFVRPGLSEADFFTLITDKFRAVSNTILNRKAIIDSKRNDSYVSKIEKIYGFVRTYATEYYGKKFMVRVPFVVGKVDGETGNVTLSMQPTDSGYIDESLFDTYISHGYISADVEKFRDQSGKIIAYAKYVEAQEGTDILSWFMLNGLNEDSFSLEQHIFLNPRDGKTDLATMVHNLFVKGSVDPNLVFLDSSTLFSPRAVITLDDFIATDALDVEWDRGIYDTIKSYLTAEPKSVSKGFAGKIADSIRDQFGGDYTLMSYAPLRLIPNLVAVPLVSNILTYGPWYAVGATGKVEYEQDDSLVPWNYAGYTGLNVAANAKVQDAYTGYQQAEHGKIEFEGVPTRNIGQTLISGGPYITNVNVSIGSDGATTTYDMSTWTQQIGGFAKYNADRFIKMALLAQQQRRAIRQLMRMPSPVNMSVKEFKRILSLKKAHPGTLRHRGRKYIPHSSSSIIACDVIPYGSGNDFKVAVNTAAIAPYRLSAQLSNDDLYKNKSAVSMDGIFAPFTTAVSSTIVDYTSYFPKFETPVTDATTPTVNDLNPYVSGDISVALPETQNIPENLHDDLHKYTGDLRGVGLKSPIIIVGWGYDIDGNPVPSGSDGGFVSNYKERADLWKAGPLDIRWDNNRKLWVTGDSTGGSFKIGKLRGNLFPSGTVNVDIFEPTTNGFQPTSEIIYNARDWLLPDGSMLSDTTQVTLQKFGEYWIITGAKRPC